MAGPGNSNSQDELDQAKKKIEVLDNEIIHMNNMHEDKISSLQD